MGSGPAKAEEQYERAAKQAEQIDTSTPELGHTYKRKTMKPVITITEDRLSDTYILSHQKDVECSGLDGSYFISDDLGSINMTYKQINELHCAVNPKLIKTLYEIKRAFDTIEDYQQEYVDYGICELHKELRDYLKELEKDQPTQEREDG